jgi:hypothetical protein
MVRLFEDTNIKDIADAIRAKNGTSTTYKTSEMAGAILGLQEGGGTSEVYNFTPQEDTRTVTIPYTKSGTPRFICVYTADATSVRASGQRMIWQATGYGDDGTYIYGGFTVTIDSDGALDHWNRQISYSIGSGTITITVEKHMLAGVLYKIIVY